MPLTTAGTARTGHVLLRYDRWFDDVDPVAPGAADARVSAIAGSLELSADEPLPSGRCDPTAAPPGPFARIVRRFAAGR